MAYTILIVDDDATIREFLTVLLTKAGYQTVTASTVPSALQVLEERQPDLLITDVRLEGYNGLHLVAMAPTPVPAIVMTGFDDRGIEADARQLGVDYLVKPVDPSVLCELIARKLATAEQHSAFTE